MAYLSKMNCYCYDAGDFDGPSFHLRLALSGTTSLLIIALLIFMVHRLRQRRLLIVMRRKWLLCLHANLSPDLSLATVLYTVVFTVHQHSSCSSVCHALILCQMIKA